MFIVSKIKEKFFKNTSAEAVKRVKRLWLVYMLPQWKLLVVSLFFMGVYSALNAWSVSLLKPVFDKVFIEKNKDILFVIAGQVIFAFGAKGVAQYIQSVTMIKMGSNFTKRLQGDLFDRIIAQDLEFFNKNNSGDLLVHFMGDLGAIRNTIVNSITTVVRDACSVMFLIILMFWKSFDMAAAMFILFPIGFYPMFYFGKKIKKIFSNQQNSFGNLYAVLAQSFQGIKIVKSYNLEESESKKIKSSAEAIAGIEVKMAKNSNILSPLMEFFGGIAAAGTLAYGGYRIMCGTLTTGDFVVFLIAIVAAYQPMKSLANLNATLQMGIMAIDRIFAIMDRKPVIANKHRAYDLKVDKGTIKVKKVKFEYVDGVEILHGVNLEVKSGEKIAIVGAAGSGKSTLINLLLRFYDVKDGSIEIDGQDIRDVSIRSLRENIAFVSQDVVLFDDTIKNNILMGRFGATYNEAIEAAKHAAAHNFIMKQEHGYDTVVGERGGSLSGGQKQMVSIARAMLKNAPILLLDEATSSLDSKSERMVQEGLEKLMKGRTSIVIAHRLSTIINSDRIYVFESGNIVEVGTHKELLALNGYYANLYKIQFMHK
ncbi:MAG: ABC transporter ATP-binding protein/permease [Endomicrobium sp.]|jgi:subfamily B ATP-binding cassette protein MsbA|nr:ABC transporter ATP-binding protein/permease [Endomicrobium sp.]